MNGIHDLGGMHGFGEVPKDDAIFHEDWERAVFALSLLGRLQNVYNLDEKRHATERLNPVDYLDLPYFGRWLLATVLLCEENDVFEEGAVEARLTELQSGESNLPERRNPELARRARQMFESNRFSEIEDGPEPAFDSGDRVVIKNQHPEGHTRAPRYTRRARGVVREYHGAFELADAAAHGEEVIEPVYSVEFTHRELWGPDHRETDTLRIDMWESYIALAEKE